MIFTEKCSCTMTDPCGMVTSCLVFTPVSHQRAEVAQSVEHMTENHGVGSSILPLGTTSHP